MNNHVNATTVMTRAMAGETSRDTLVSSCTINETMTATEKNTNAVEHKNLHTKVAVIS